MKAWRAPALVMLLGAALQGVHAAEQRVRIGRAHDPQSGALVYVEHHVETVAAGRVVGDDVSYRDAAGRVFARKRVDFGDRPLLPTFRLDDGRTGHMEALERLGGGVIEVRYRERAGAPGARVRLPAPDDALADAGFDRFIESHWDTLASGDSVVRRFLVPSRLGFMDLRIRRDATATGGDTVCFVLEVDSVLLRLVVDPITVVYDARSRRLLRYEGLSNLRDADGGNRQVRIDFEYPGRLAGHATTGGVTRTGAAPGAP